ncbi:MAG: hypothetical protein Q8R92_06230 [Deltaproteobacteria bacterium]|nr:hypothetical protein [Deltaproteobacteria bacterium]
MLKKKGKGKPGSGFKYHPRTGDDVKKRAEQKGGQFDSIIRSGIDRWRPKDGENIIRILPPTWEDHDHYGLDIWVHAFVGPDRSTYLCPQKMKNEPCPICKLARESKASGEDDEAKQLQSQRRVAVWILDRDDEKSTPMLFDMSWSMDRDIAALCHNKRTGKVLLIDHPDEGYDILFTRTGKGLNTRYIGMAVDRESSPIMGDEGEQEKMLTYIQENPIPDVLNFYDSDYLDKMINAEVSEKDAELDPEEEEEVESRHPRKKTSSSKRARDDKEPEEEAEEEEVEEEEVEEEAPPSRSAGRSRSVGSRNRR